jgi:hypothetical protein
MVLIKKVETGFYRIPLSVTLTDSTHGEMKAFELMTIRLRDAQSSTCAPLMYNWECGIDLSGAARHFRACPNPPSRLILVTSAR